MTLLTKDTARQIVRNAVDKSGVLEREEALRERRADWAEKVRVRALGGPEADTAIQKVVTEVQSLLAKLPPNVPHVFQINAQSYIKVKMGPLAVRAYFNGELKPTSAPLALKVTPPVFQIPAGCPVADEWQGIRQEALSISSASDEVRRRMAATVNRFETVEALLEAWPGAAELLPSDLVLDAPDIPELPTDELDELIGLSKEGSK